MHSAFDGTTNSVQAGGNCVEFFHYSSIYLAGAGVERGGQPTRHVRHPFTANRILRRIASVQYLCGRPRLPCSALPALRSSRTKCGTEDSPGQGRGGRSCPRGLSLHSPEELVVRQLKRVGQLLDCSGRLQSSAVEKEATEIPRILHVRNHRQTRRKWPG